MVKMKVLKCKDSITILIPSVLSLPLIFKLCDLQQRYWVESTHIFLYNFLSNIFFSNNHLPSYMWITLKRHMETKFVSDFRHNFNVVKNFSKIIHHILQKSSQVFWFITYRHTDTHGKAKRWIFATLHCEGNRKCVIQFKCRHKIGVMCIKIWIMKCHLFT